MSRVAQLGVVEEFSVWTAFLMFDCDGFPGAVFTDGDKDLRPSRSEDTYLHR